MKRKSAWLVLTLIVLAGAFLTQGRSVSSSPPVPMMAPNVFNVNSTADIFSPGGSTVTLRSAIAAANTDLSANPSVINVPPGTYKLTLTNATEENAGVTGDLDITTTLHSVTIVGSGATGPNATIVDASGLNTGSLHDRVFHITGSGVTAVFQNLVIENGQATNDGTNGASTDPATPNNGDRAGGGILNNGGSVTLNNVIIQSCQSLGRGDAAGAPAGSILEGRGAGLASVGATGNVMITGSTLTGNSAQGGNGTAGANVNIASGAKGGGIYFEGGTLNIAGSRIDTSSAIGGNGQDAPPIDNGMLNGGQGGPAQGGGLWVGGSGTVTINNTTVAGTSAIGGGAGGGGNSGFNGGEADGGGIYSLGNVTVTNSTFNAAAATGGSCNSSAGKGAFGSHTAGDGGMAQGGAIFADGGSLIVDTDTLANNTALGGNGGDGGQTDHSGIFDFGQNGKGGIAQGGAITNNTATVTIKHATISLNNAHGGNSGVDEPGVDKPLRPVAEGTGGGIRVGAGSVTLEDTIIGGNTAANGSGDTTAAPTPGPDVDGAVNSTGHNLLTNTTNATGFTGTGDITGVSPMLAPLADNGGPTHTMALLAGSPAIDAGVADGAMFDQRGMTRTVDDPLATDAATSDETDIGAFEFVPPCILTCPANITVGNDPNQCGAVVNYTTSSSAGCGTVTCVPPAGSFFPVGTTTVNCTSQAGPACSFTVTVNDTQAPTIALSGQAITLWPPNHKYVTINVSDLVTGVTDNCDHTLGVASVKISMVTSDEPDSATGQGNTTHDIVIAPDCKSVQLRAERSGNGNGRVYTITLKVADASGNVTTATAHVTVPHSQNGAPAVDDGPHYTVASNCP